jgi:hypothetical protein
MFKNETISLRTFFRGGVEPSPLSLRPLLAYCTSSEWWRVCSKKWNANGQGNRSIRRNPVQVKFFPPQIPYDLNRARTRAAAVQSRRLIAWSKARPCIKLITNFVLQSPNWKSVIGSEIITISTRALKCTQASDRHTLKSILFIIHFQ